MSKAFISYSHFDERILNRLDTHMSLLKRDGLITSWSDREIDAGGVLNREIDSALKSSNIFLAIVSPDYLNSPYCYDVEFKEAQKRHEEGSMLIIPIIAQPCDWKSSPFSKLKAVPKDGKPISEWTNENNAFLNVVEDLRSLLEKKDALSISSNELKATIKSNRTYHVKRDFDEVDRLNFRDESFKTIHDYFAEALDEINDIADIKCRFVREILGSEFTCIITNRKKINATGYISVSVADTKYFGDNSINFTLGERLHPNTVGNNFVLENDDYDLFWKQHLNMLSYRNEDKKLSAKDIASQLWNEFIKQVGIDDRA